jgi:5-(carboxyamino)imidazole ribonucleotide mutase
VLKKVAIIMGSDSDLSIMKEAATALQELNVDFKMQIVSAHRTPKEMAQFAESAGDQGYGVIIAGAGGAAHLPGMVAAHTVLPVIGVPVPIGPLAGQDALWSIVQMPKGVPVATVAIGNAYNAGLLAAQILGVTDESLAKRLKDHREGMRQASLAKKIS